MVFGVVIPWSQLLYPIHLNSDNPKNARRFPRQKFKETEKSKRQFILHLHFPKLLQNCGVPLLPFGLSDILSHLFSLSDLHCN